MNRFLQPMVVKAIVKTSAYNLLQLQHLPRFIIVICFHACGKGLYFIHLCICNLSTVLGP